MSRQWILFIIIIYMRFYDIDILFVKIAVLQYKISISNVIIDAAA